MKTVMVLMAGAMILAAGNGPGMDERARVKYGRTAIAVSAAAHCAGCAVRAVAVPERVLQAHVKYGLALPVQRVTHTCCAQGE